MELRAESIARQWTSNILIVTKLWGLTERCEGSSFRLQGNAAFCCNTAAESRRESALVDAKIPGCHFWLLTAPFQIMKYKAKEAKQRLACPPWKTLGKLQLCHPDKTLKRNWLDFTVQQSTSPLSAHGRADCLLLSAQRYILYCASQPIIYTSGRPGCALMHF